MFTMMRNIIAPDGTDGHFLKIALNGRCGHLSDRGDSEFCECAPTAPPGGTRKIRLRAIVRTDA